MSTHKSALLIWNRLEGKPKSQNLERALKAEIRDPLWMLFRQWQFGEFKGEDAAIPIFAQIRYEETFPEWIKARTGDQETLSREEPLNPWVETSRFALDLSMRIEIGLHWIKMIGRTSLAEQGAIIDSFLENDNLQFNLPEDEDPNAKYANAQSLSNEELINSLHVVSSGRAIDGEKLLALIADPDRSVSKEILQTKHAELDQLGDQLLSWAKRLYAYREPKNKAWHSSHLEYQFAVGVEKEEGQQIGLKAEEYFGQQIEWHQFELETASLAEEERLQEEQLEEVFHVPVQVNYPGMPRTRWWEMEDARVNFGNIKTSTTNPARLLFAQFNLIYGNDWFLLPLDVTIGSLVQVKEIIVEDNFGLRTSISPTPSHSSSPWSFFNFHNNDNQWGDNWLYYPQAASDIQKGEPVEQITFIRDEMANMVWAIETTVSDKLNKGVSGYQRASESLAFIKKLEVQDNFEPSFNSAKLKYQLSTTVPENWIPFIPVHILDDGQSRQIQLQRASMPRLIRGFPAQRVRPQSFLLNEGIRPDGIQPYFIYEEEIPRAGAIVKGLWKRTRWIDGKTYIWYAREKTVGRGEGSSGLKFDFLEGK